MNLTADSRLLDIGSGLGGSARALAEAYGYHVTGIDLTQAFCEAATAMSDWVAVFKLLNTHDSTDEDQNFFGKMTAQMVKTGSASVAGRVFLADDSPVMARNQVQ